jgi:hypothetical protein
MTFSNCVLELSNKYVKQQVKLDDSQEIVSDKQCTCMGKQNPTGVGCTPSYFAPVPMPITMTSAASVSQAHHQSLCTTATVFTPKQQTCTDLVNAKHSYLRARNLDKL